MLFTESLKSNLDFRTVYKSGKSRANQYLVMIVLKKKDPVNEELKRSYNRLGISVSKKVGNSVIRHKIKRLVKESYRLHEKMFNSGLDIVVIARSGAADLGFYDVESALLHLSKLHGINKDR